MYSGGVCSLQFPVVGLALPLSGSGSECVPSRVGAGVSAGRESRHRTCCCKCGVSCVPVTSLCHTVPPTRAALSSEQRARRDNQSLSLLPEPVTVTLHSSREDENFIL